MQVFDISIENLKTVLNGFGFKVCNLYDEIMIKGCPEKNRNILCCYYRNAENCFG